MPRAVSRKAVRLVDRWDPLEKASVRMLIPGCARRIMGLSVETKFTKSLSNKRTEKAGLRLLLSDPRFQVVDLPTKRRILELVGRPGTFGTQTFDVVMTPEPVPPITTQNVDAFFPDLRLVEMKTTRKSVRNASLEGFFFGATEREYEMARALGDRYLFAFIVLTGANDYGRPFAVLLTLDEVQRRTRVQRVQYQVNFHSDLATVGGPGESWLVLLGDERDLPGGEPPAP